MANFFKEYQATVKAKKEEEARRKYEDREKAREIADYFYSLVRGQRVKVDKAYAENGYLYFADNLDDGHILLSETKKEAVSGYGYIYSKDVVIRR